MSEILGGAFEQGDKGKKKKEDLSYELRGDMSFVKDDGLSNPTDVESTSKKNFAEGRAPNEIPRGRFRNEHNYQDASADALAKLNKKKDEEDLTKLRDGLLRGQGGK